MYKLVNNEYLQVISQEVQLVFGLLYWYHTYVIVRFDLFSGNSVSWVSLKHEKVYLWRGILFS